MLLQVARVSILRTEKENGNNVVVFLCDSAVELSIRLPQHMNNHPPHHEVDDCKFPGPATAKNCSLLMRETRVG